MDLQSMRSYYHYYYRAHSDLDPGLFATCGGRLGRNVDPLQHLFARRVCELTESVLCAEEIKASIENPIDAVVDGGDVLGVGY